MTNEILILIASYLDAVYQAVAALQSYLETTALLGAVRRNRELRFGRINSTTTYRFHGVGCRVTSDGRTVDFDFGPGSAIGGFDAWRLWIFAGENPQRFPQWQERDRVEAALDQIQAEGKIELLRKDPSPHLLYLTPAGEKSIAALQGFNLTTTMTMEIFVI